jgi:hypothetical protein
MALTERWTGEMIWIQGFDAKIIELKTEMQKTSFLFLLLFDLADDTRRFIQKLSEFSYS